MSSASSTGDKVPSSPSTQTGQRWWGETFAWFFNPLSPSISPTKQRRLRGSVDLGRASFSPSQILGKLQDRQVGNEEKDEFRHHAHEVTLDAAHL